MGGCWSGSRSEVDVPQARHRYEDRRTLVYNNIVVPSRDHYVPATRVPAPYVPVKTYEYVPSTTYVPSARVPTRLPSPVVPAFRELVPSTIKVTVPEKHCYGEYKCTCGRFWNSTLSWPKAPQGCKKCKRNVYPHTQRTLLPSDFTDDTEAKHLTELCPKCKELGRHCGYLRSNANNKKGYSKSNNSHCQNGRYNNNKRKQLGYHCNNSRQVSRIFKSSFKDRY